MNQHVLRYFQSGTDEAGSFHKVIALHEEPTLEWEEVAKRCPGLPRGWFELAQLTSEERLEFLRGFWGSSLPFVPHVNEAIDLFFGNLEDVGVFMTQTNAGDHLVPQLAYGLVGEGGFYHGFAPASDEEIGQLQGAFPEQILPDDYIAFLRVHNGFSKVTDTGVTPCALVPQETKAFHRMLAERPPLTWANGEGVNVEGLIPFYQSFGMECYQCFCSDWYPEQEMGNLYYSGVDHTISDYRARESAIESLAFPTFLDWLIFYLEGCVE